ncbi:MAG: DUF4388 domain-containing protein [Thermoanaerobaculia bacterium]|nr:DUF4388 domain-containing protein [Thermoanaerobaculia bacterium]
MAIASEKKHQYRGDLSRTALPEMLHTIYLHRVPGVIEATRNDVEKRIFLRDGAVIHASSSDPQDRLGRYLLRAGVITEEEFKVTMAERRESLQRYGEMLVERDVMTPAALYEAIQEQMRGIVWSLFSWSQGQVSFSIGPFEDNEMIRIHLPMRQVVLQGIKRAPDAKALVARLGRKDTIFEPTWATETLIETALNAEELTLLRMVNGKRTLYELCTTGPFAPAENARMIYAFHVLRLMKRQQVAPGSGGIKIRLKA